MRGAFVMNDFCGWLEPDREATRLYCKTEVDVFVVRGPEALVKTADVVPRRAAESEARSRAIVNVAGIRDFGVRGRMPPPKMSSVAIVPDDRPGFLGFAIWQE